MSKRLPVYILAGGRSTRFGSDKARAPFHGQPLILHVANVVARFATRCTVVAAVPDQYADLGLPTIADSTPNAGPLGGLIRAFSDLRDEDRLLLVSCDLVVLDAALVQQLVRAAHGTHAAVAFYTDRWQPIPGVYARRLMSEAESRLRSGDGSLARLLDAYGFAFPIANWNGVAVNANTPEALLAAQARTTDSTGRLNAAYDDAHGPATSASDTLRSKSAARSDQETDFGLRRFRGHLPSRDFERNVARAPAHGARHQKRDRDNTEHGRQQSRDRAGEVKRRDHDRCDEADAPIGSAQVSCHRIPPNK